MMVAEYKNEFECLVSRVEDQFVDKLPKAILATDAWCAFLAKDKFFISWLILLLRKVWPFSCRGCTAGAFKQHFQVNFEKIVGRRLWFGADGRSDIPHQFCLPRLARCLPQQPWLRLGHRSRSRTHVRIAFVVVEQFVVEAANKSISSSHDKTEINPVFYENKIILCSFCQRTKHVKTCLNIMTTYFACHQS